MQSLDGHQIDWSEEDKIYLALQLFQQRERRYGSRWSAAQVLFEHLAAYQPDWEDLPLPTGRTVAQGRAVFSAFSRQNSGPSTAQSAGPSPGSFGISVLGGSAGGVPSRKRSAPSSDALTPIIGRPLAPKQPSAFGQETATRPSITGYQSMSPMVDPSPRPHEPRKKRGRPTKQEAEERRRQMEERQQRRMQVQASQATQSIQGGHAAGGAPPQFVSLAQPGTTGAQPHLLQDEVPHSSMGAPPLVGGTPKTPYQPISEEQNSSGSSGKRRKLRPPRLSGSDAEPPPPPSFINTVSEDSIVGHPRYAQPSLAHDRREAKHIEGQTAPSEYTGGESELLRFEIDEDNRTMNPRSRPWEVMERSGP